MAGALQNISVSDYHTSEVGLKNNIDKVVKEGQAFTLVASVNTKVQNPVEILITPKEGEENRYDNLPDRLIIPTGKSSIESYPLHGHYKSFYQCKSAPSLSPYEE